MLARKRLAPVVLAAVISVGSVGAIASPAMAATSKHWTSAQCKTWEKSFAKRNPHASKTRKAEANKVLKGKACTVRVK